MSEEEKRREVEENGGEKRRQQGENWGEKREGEENGR